MQSKIPARDAKAEDITDRKVKIAKIPETGELEIQIPATGTSSAKKVKFPEETSEQYKLTPDKFIDVQDAIESYQSEDREVVVYADSIECRVGYDSLIRVLGNFIGRQYAYFRSEKGGSLSVEEAGKRAYESSYNDFQATDLLNNLLIMPTDQIGFADLTALHRDNPAMAQNLWEVIKREAQREFESGHRAADAFEPADYMKDAWNRASYLGLRESFCKEWKPVGGIELSMIDAIVQAFLQLQFWTKESVLRSRTKPREEDYKRQNEKKIDNARNKNRPPNELWDIPLVSEQSAVEHAAQMADRWQRMYFRAIRNLRDFRRYKPQVTINNPAQVNIAAEGGQQINSISDF